MTALDKFFEGTEYPGFIPFEKMSKNRKTNQEVEQKLSGQLTGDLQMKEVVVSVVGPGEVFGWSGMVAPHQAAAGAKATTECRVVAFDAQELTNQFQKDCEFGYLMMQKIAQVVAGRLRDIRIESLSRIIA